MIIIKTLKKLFYDGKQYEPDTIITFGIEHKYGLATLEANKCIEIIPQAIEKEEIKAEKKTDDATIREEIFTLLLQKDKDQATERLSEEIQQEIKFYATRFDEKSELYHYSEGIYISNGKSIVKEYCRSILGVAYTEQLSNRVIAKIEADNYIEQEDLLKRHYADKVCCLNGILDLNTRELTEYDPEMIFLSKIPITYDTIATCQAIDTFFSEILPEPKDVLTIQEWFGNCLQGKYPIQKIGLFIGEGANGKGQTLDLLRKFLGEQNCSAIPLQKLEGMDFKESELFSRFANIGADISNQPLKETSKIKGLSGGDLINASVKFKNDLVFMNEAKLLFSANELPKTYDLTPAFFRRWTYLIFPYQFKTQEEIETLPKHTQKICKIKTADIINKILTPEELSGMLNQALDGLDRLTKQGDFTSSNTAEQTKNWWIQNSDSCLAFCWEELEENPTEYITKDDFRKNYNQYCRRHKLPAEGKKHIYEVLTRKIRAWDSQMSDGTRIWNGIKLKNIVVLAKEINK